MVLRLLSLLAALAAAATDAPAPAPNFTCTTAGGDTYQIWLGARNRLVATEKRKAREIVLSGANVARDGVPQGKHVYSGWKPGGKDMFELLDLSTEFTAHYVVIGGSTKVVVGVVIDHRERFGLTCRASHIAVEVLSLERDAPAPHRYAAQIAEVAALRTVKGTATPIAILAIEAAVRRMFNSPDYRRKGARAEFIESLAPSLKLVDSRSIFRIGQRMTAPPELAAFWKTVLEESKYANYPEAARFAEWIKEGSRPDPQRELRSIVAGFQEFYRARSFRDKDIRAFFLREVMPGLKTLSEGEAVRVQNTLSDEAGNFFLQVWMKSVGRRTIADYPQIQGVARDLASILQPKDFDPARLEARLIQIMKSPMLLDPEARLIFFQTVSSTLRRLTPRQREDFLAFIDDENVKRFFLDLVQ